MKKHRIVFATGNAGKMKEIRQIMADLGCEVVSMKEAGANPEIVENGASFAENAEIKARLATGFKRRLGDHAQNHLTKAVVVFLGDVECFSSVLRFLHILAERQAFVCAGNALRACIAVFDGYGGEFHMKLGKQVFRFLS